MTDYPEKSIGLCLSGGGFRASLYHLGVLRYLAETGQLANVGSVSAVSGGSIIAAYLAIKWEELRKRDFSLDAFMEEVYNPFIEHVTTGNFRNRWLILCLVTLPLLLWPNFTWSVLWSRLFDRWFYDNKRFALRDLPEDLELVLNATNLSSAQAFRMACVLCGDDTGYENGVEHSGRAVRLADAVTASAAHVPMSITFGDRRLWFMDGGVFDNTGLDWYLNASHRPRPEGIHRPDFLVISDASPELMEWNWAWMRFIPLYRMFGVVGRISDILQEQTRRTRKDRFIERIRDCGMNIGIMISIDVVASRLRELQRSDQKDELEAVALPEEVVERVRAVRTDLDNFLPEEAKLLAYHGYSLAHVYLRMFHGDARIGGHPASIPGDPGWKLELSPADIARYLDSLSKAHSRFDSRRRWF
jgi:predicted acylesterase/phospholipase RssA